MEVDLGGLPILLGLVAVPMQDLTDWPAVAAVPIDCGIANRDGAAGLHPGQITRHLGQFVVRPAFVAAGKPG